MTNATGIYGSSLEDKLTDEDIADILDSSPQAHPIRAVPPKCNVWTLGELLTDPLLLQPPEAIIPNIAYAGRTTLIAGQDKAGKSTLATQAVAALTSGADFLGERLSQQRALWFALDEYMGDLVRRAHAFGADRELLVVTDECPECVETFAEVLRETQPSVVVVDVLHRWWLSSVRDENDSVQVSKFLTPRIREARAQNVALVLLHHTGKSGVAYRGSSDIGASVDIRATLRASQRSGSVDEPTADDGRRLFEVIGRAGVRASLTLSFDGTRYSLGDHALPLSQRILRELADGDASATELAGILQKRKEIVLAAVRALLSDGHATRRGQRVAITAQGLAVLSAESGSREETDE